jgi:hypothetical protein
MACCLVLLREEKTTIIHLPKIAQCKAGEADAGA